jgi:NAD(P)-dependent dehydrogenase (short-subunit alcohol dehydrogenase family)
VWFCWVCASRPGRASAGIGVDTARALARTGASVTLAVRDTHAGVRAAADITSTTGNDRGHVARLDLADRGSIAAFVAAWEGPLHVLVNNAGVMALPEQHTPEGWEMQFAINHLGHFALAFGLHDALAAAGTARIVSVSSSAHQSSPVGKRTDAGGHPNQPAAAPGRDDNPA